MNKDSLINNIIDQIKEAQLKLGYAKETLRFYYPVSSLNAILETSYADEEQMVIALNSSMELRDTIIGELKFATHGGRIEVSVPPEGAEYVDTNVPTPRFLLDIINLFRNHHSCEITDVKAIFSKYSEKFCCNKMPDGMDFDYVLYFLEPGIDEYYYCIKMEMGHTIYHRFTREDYQLMFE